jgi:hypothetical protein
MARPILYNTMEINRDWARSSLPSFRPDGLGAYPNALDNLTRFTRRVLIDGELDHDLVIEFLQRIPKIDSVMYVVNLPTRPSSPLATRERTKVYETLADF